MRLFRYLSTEFPWCTSGALASDCLNTFSVLTDEVTGTSAFVGVETREVWMTGDGKCELVCGSSNVAPTINVTESRSRSSSLDDSSRSLKYLTSLRKPWRNHLLCKNFLFAVWLLAHDMKWWLMLRLFIYTMWS